MTTHGLQPRVPARASAPRGEVDVWYVVVSQRLADADVLSEVDRDRARRFVFPAVRLRYVVSHCATWRILSQYRHDVGASALCFRAGAFGKPALVDGGGLQFNLSHSGAAVVLAVAWAREVGVDLEEHRPIDHRQLSRTCFSPAERDALERVPASERMACFFRGWTRKEAYVKARGAGLSLPLDSFDVALERDRAALLATRPDDADAARWTMDALDLGEGRSAAVAYEGARTRVRLRRWPGGLELAPADASRAT